MDIKAGIFLCFLTPVFFAVAVVFVVVLNINEIILFSICCQNQVTTFSLKLTLLLRQSVSVTYESVKNNPLLLYYFNDLVIK